MRIKYGFLILASALSVTCIAPAMAGQLSTKTIVISSPIQFADGAYIPNNVKSGCDVPSEQSKWLTQELRSHGFTVVHPDDAAAQGAAILQIQISSAYSEGNPVTGHSKGLSISGKLFQNNQQLGSFIAFRKSSGGFFGVFKGSCSVLYRCAKTLGEDVAKWLEAPTDNAKLGNAQ